MRRFWGLTFVVAAALLTVQALVSAQAGAGEKDKDKEKEKPSEVYPAAIFTFEERGAGVKDMGAKVADILFAKLAARPELYLVDRSDLKKILSELELNISGVVKP